MQDYLLCSCCVGKTTGLYWKHNWNRSYSLKTSLTVACAKECTFVCLFVSRRTTEYGQRNRSRKFLWVFWTFSPISSGIIHGWKQQGLFRGLISTSALVQLDWIWGCWALRFVCLSGVDGPEQELDKFVGFPSRCLCWNDHVVVWMQFAKSLHFQKSLLCSSRHRTCKWLFTVTAVSEQVKWYVVYQIGT